MANILTIDGVDYDVDGMSENAKAQIYNVRATDREIARVKALLSMLETARRSYAKALKSELGQLAPGDSTD